MPGKVKRDHANDLKLPEIDEYQSLEPIAKQKRMRMVTLVEPEDMETESENEDDDLNIPYDRERYCMPLVIV